MKQTGQQLKELREERGLSLNEVSLALKINNKTLRAIEEGNVSQLPAITFLRGFVQTYASYLKADTTQVMQLFNEEMGLQKQVNPHPYMQAPAETPAPEKFTVDPEKWSMTVKGLLILGAVTLVILIFIVKQQIEKYEREKQIGQPVAVATDVQPVVEEPASTSTDLSVEPTSPPSDSKSAASTPTPTEEPKAETATPSKTPVAATPAPTPSVSTPAKPIEKPVEKSIVATPPPLVPAPKTVETVAEKPPVTATPISAPPAAPKPTPVSAPVVAAAPIAEAQNTEKPKPVDGAPQEIIVEALDKVNIEFTIDNGRTVKMSLQPGEVQIIKAKNSVKLTASEGKAINVTQNGRDRGVPGSVGKPINLNYP